MKQRQWIPSVWRLKRAAASGPAQVLAARLPGDAEEQAERIRNLAADTALKLQSIDHATIYLRLAVSSVFLALGSLLIAAASLYYSHHAQPRSHEPLISGAPRQQNVI